MSEGIIEVICGPMFSGKTEELIKRLRRAQIARQRVIVFKPAIDIRYAETHVVSHSQMREASIPVDAPMQIDLELQKLDYAFDVIAIDEAQFFGADIIELAERLARRGKRVIIAGLDQDYLGKPFGHMPELLAIGDLVTKQCAVCMVCGQPASKSQRIVKTSSHDHLNQVLVGDFDFYEARCRKCHELQPQGSLDEC